MTASRDDTQERDQGVRWLESANCRVILDMTLTARHAETFTELDEAAVAKTIAGSGADAAVTWFKDENGFAAYPTAFGPMHPRLLGRDLSGRLLKALKMTGVRVVGYSCVGLDRHYAELHPEDPIVYSDGLPGFVPIPCLTSNYGEYVFRQIEEIVRNYPLDGLWLDVVWFPQKDFLPDPESHRGPTSEAFSCYCASCEERYRSEYGAPIPPSPLEGTEAWGQWVADKHAVLDNFLKETRTRVQALNPMMPITHNLTAFNQHDGRGGLSWHSIRHADWGSLESYYPWTGHLQTSILPRMLRGIGQGLSFEVAILSHGELWDWTPKSVDQLTAEAMTIAANGGAVAIDDHLLPSGKLQIPLYTRFAEVFERVKRFQQWTSPGETVKYVAVVYSERSRDLFGRCDPARYQASFDGACRALIEAKLPFDILPDEYLSAETLSRYHAVLLPNVACMSDETCRVIGAASRLGIGIVACGESSLYDERGNPRADFGIPEFGVRSAGGRINSAHVFVEFENAEDDLCLGLTPGLAVNMKKPGLRVEGVGRRVGSMRLPMVWACNHFYHYYENPPGEQTAGAAIWVSEAVASVATRASEETSLSPVSAGGKSVYFPVDIAASYGEFGIPEARMLLTNAIRFAAGEPEIGVRGPDSVEAIYLEQSELDRVEVHLINFPSVSGRSALIGGQVESTQVVGNIPAAHDLELVLGTAFREKARRVRSVANGNIAWSRGDDRIALPPIAIHDVIVVETA